MGGARIAINKAIKKMASEDLSKSLIACPLCRRMIKKRFLENHFYRVHKGEKEGYTFEDFEEAVHNVITQQKEYENENV